MGEDATLQIAGSFSSGVSSHSPRFGWHTSQRAPAACGGEKCFAIPIRGHHLMLEAHVEGSLPMRSFLLNLLAESPDQIAR